MRRVTEDASRFVGSARFGTATTAWRHSGRLLRATARALLEHGWDDVLAELLAVVPERVSSPERDY